MTGNANSAAGGGGTGHAGPPAPPGPSGSPGSSGPPGLPASVEAAWGLRDRPSKGPKPGLTLARIVDAAVGLAAAEGLAAVSMGRVAKELGVSTMSLYRYVAAKNELYILMLEVALGAPPPPPDRAVGWREALTLWARAQRAAFHRNLWSLRLPISGPPSTPNMVAWWERGMVALDGTGLDDGARLSVILLVSGYVRNEALVMADLDAAVEASGATPRQVMEGYENTLRRLADPARYPSVARLMAEGGLGEAGSGGEEEADAEFTFGLNCLLDGVEALIRRRG